MASQFTIDPRFDGQAVRIHVIGSLGVDSIASLEGQLIPLLRPPGVTLDFRRADMVEEVVSVLIELGQRYTNCRISVVNISPRFKPWFDNHSAKQNGLELAYGERPPIGALDV